jgi:DnaK suppressor protein
LSLVETGEAWAMTAAADLARKRAALEAQLQVLTAAPANLGGISFGKRVGEGTSIAVERLSQIAAHDRIQATLAEVARAEAKLEEGSYGTCDRCEQPIGPERLEAVPWATMCVRCASRA